MSVGFTQKSSYFRALNRWELLATVPDHCIMTADSPGSWIELELHNNLEKVLKISRESVERLQAMREEEGCGSNPITFVKAKAAYHQILDYDETAVLFDVAVPGYGDVTTCMTAEYNAEFPNELEIGTGMFGEGRYVACSDPSGWTECVSSMENSVDAANRRLSSNYGLLKEDPHITASDRQLAMDRMLQQALVSSADDVSHIRPPVMHRDLTDSEYIASLPADFAPHLGATSRGNYAHCYAGAKMQDQGQCGLCYAAATVTMMSIRRCIALSQTGRIPAPAEYNYATQEFAGCACSQLSGTSEDPSQNCDKRSQCEGGNLGGVWDNWMRLVNGGLRRDDCEEYTHKCKESSGIVNPSMGSSAQCAAHAHLGLWERPCNCIDASVRSLPWEECNFMQDSCASLARPDRMYLLAVRPQGLSVENTLNNIKAHMIEAGPLYTTVEIPASFGYFFGGPHSEGARGDVYTESAQSEGGHAIVMVGWGKTTAHQPRGLTGYGHDYWIIRNSWGSWWNGHMAGYAHILAGQDIIKIESNLGAGFFGQHPDHAAPSCKWVTYTEFPMKTPLGFARYTVGLTVLCSEDATVEIIIEQAQKTAGSRIFYKSRPFRCDGALSGAICSFDGIDLLAAGYGLTGASTEAQVIVRSWDANGNEAWIPYGIALTSAGEGVSQDHVLGFFLGTPGTYCNGCSTEDAYPEPAGLNSFTRLVNMGYGGDTIRQDVPPTLEDEPECAFFGSTALGALFSCNIFYYLGFLGLLCCIGPITCFMCKLRSARKKVTAPRGPAVGGPPMMSAPMATGPPMRR